MDEDDRRARLGAMYGADDDEEQAREDDRRRARAAADEVRRTGRSCVVRINDKEVEVPTMAYVRQLERTVEEQKRGLARMEAMLRDASRLVNQQAREIGGLRSDVAKAKWDI